MNEPQRTTDETRGVFRKYDVTRTDGSSRAGGKHEDCAYFVLDLEHDPFAIPALKAYAKACRMTHPALAKDIGQIVSTGDRGRFFAGPSTPNEAMNEIMGRHK